VREYIRACYAALAQAAPEFIWVDDDVRLEHHPKAVTHACLCDYCLAEFAGETGVARTREQLSDAFASADRSECLALRRQWLEHNRNYISRLLGFIREAVDSVDPAIALGYMGTDLQYSGLGFDRWLAALAGSRRLPVKFRPGGGFYNDDIPLSMLDKMHAVGRQIAFADPVATELQYEHENFPYYPLRKSHAVFVAEMAAAIATGCDGTALNILGNSLEPYKDFGAWLTAVEAARPLLDEMAATFAPGPVEGVWHACTRDRYAATNIDGQWPSVDAWTIPGPEQVYEIGIPPAYSPSGAHVALLTGDNVLEFGTERLIDMFRNGIALDGAALSRLDEIGLADMTGFRPIGTRKSDMTEKLSADSLNGEYAGAIRDCRPSFWEQTTHLLEPTAGARILSECIDLAGYRHGCSSGAFENRLGGRVAVFGYFPWSGLQGPAKAAQMRRVLQWLSGEALPAIAGSLHRLAIWCRRDRCGNPAVFVLNASIDPAENAALRVRTGGAAYEGVGMTGVTTELAPGEVDADGLVTLGLPVIGPWAGLLVRCKP
jgi:hypothetical protein